MREINRALHVIYQSDPKVFGTSCVIGSMSTKELKWICKENLIYFTYPLHCPCSDLLLLIVYENQLCSNMCDAKMVG